MLIDVLGVRARWANEGAAGATDSFAELENLVSEALAQAESTVVEAALESDTALILFRSTNAAVRTAKALFLDAFLQRTAAEERSRRLWLRGVIVPRPARLNFAQLRTQYEIGDERVPIVVNELAKPLLEAIALERSGFRGMRVLLHPRLITFRVRAAAEIAGPSGKTATQLKRLTGPGSYPPTLERFEDVLRMATESQRDWRRLSERMARRLRMAAHDDEEVRHAAATQILFDACDEQFGTRARTD